MTQPTDDWFIGLFARYSRALRRYLTRFSVSKDTAADVAQEAFLRVYAASRETRPEQSRAFLYQVARNLMLNHLRARSRAGAEVPLDFDDLGSYESFPSLEQASIDREEFEALVAAIDVLPPQCQRVFILRKVHQYSYREIAEELGIAVSTVEKHVAYGTRACAAFLEQRERGTASVTRLSGGAGRE